MEMGDRDRIVEMFFFFISYESFAAVVRSDSIIERR
jgi:hypothetical protein